jgi:dTDP-glucose 4,6-dehydratase
MNILVTGGSGFLGSHLCDLLLSKGNGVICVDNLITGDVANIEHLKDNRDFRFIQQDVTDHIRIDTKIDYILHFASPASPVDFPRIPIQILKAGALGTLNALELAVRNRAKFLLASSSEV